MLQLPEEPPEPYSEWGWQITATRYESGEASFFTGLDLNSTDNYDSWDTDDTGAQTKFVT